jgi:signal transduction histidine kinase
MRRSAVAALVPALGLGLCGVEARAAPREIPRAVLVLDAGEASQPFFLSFMPGFAEALRGSDPVSIHTLSLDLWRFGTPEHAPAIDALVRDRYRGFPIGVIVATTDPVIALALSWRDAFWPGTPIVCLASGAEGVRRAEAAGGTTVIRVNLDHAATLRAALALLPDTKHVAVVGGVETRGRILPDVRPTVRAVDAKLDLIDLAGLSMPELRRRVATLPPRTIILDAGINVDGEGRHWVPRNAHDFYAPFARSPMFAVHGTLLGHGIVGGLLLNADALGREAAERVLRLLAGAPAGSMPTSETRSMRLLFDNRELERWGIPDDRLPPGSEIVFRPPSFWQEHKGMVVATGVALLLQSLAITSLLLERRRRRTAELGLRRLSAQLLTAQEEERSRIARDLHDDAGQRLALLAIELDQGQQTQGLADQARLLSSDLHRLAHQLHPAILDQLGFLPAARRFAEELSARHGVEIDVSSDDWPAELPRVATLVLYRVMQEALQNAVKHSGAPRIQVAFGSQEDALFMQVADLGRGFDPEELLRVSGLGFAGMRERLRLLGGELRVETARGGGTMVEARVPREVLSAVEGDARRNEHAPAPTGSGGG